MSNKLLDHYNLYLKFPTFPSFGYEVGEILGKNIIDIAALPEYRSVIRKNIAAGYNKKYEIKAQRKDGTIFPLQIQAREVQYKGKILRVASVKDLS